MVSTIQHYRSLTAAAVPPSLVAGRIAINQTDGLLFYRDAGGAVAKRLLRDASKVIARGQVAAVAQLDLSIDPAVIGIMRGFCLRIGDAVPVTSGTSLGMRFGDVTSVKTLSTYAWLSLNSGSGGGGGWDSSDSRANYMDLMAAGSSGVNPMNSEIFIGTNDPAPTMYRRGAWISQCRDGSSAVNEFSGGGWYENDIDITRIRIFMVSGNIAKMKYCLSAFP